MKKNRLYFFLIIMVFIIGSILFFTISKKEIKTVENDNETTTCFFDGPNGPKIREVKTKDIKITKTIEGETVAELVVILKGENFESTWSTGIKISEKNGGTRSTEVLDGQFLLEMKLVPNKSFKPTETKKP